MGSASLQICGEQHVGGRMDDGLPGAVKNTGGGARLAPRANPAQVCYE